MSRTQADAANASAKMDAKIATQTAPQLVTLWRILRNVNTTEAAIVRGRLYVRLCELVGDDAADAACE